jgi:uncharacterized protein
MNILDDQKKEIVECLKLINPKKVILFGSHAWGKAGKDSDIDIYVVTNNDYTPKNFSEKMDMKLRVSNMLLEFRKKHPIDLLVHTIPMHEKFIAFESSLARQIMAKGEELS